VRSTELNQGSIAFVLGRLATHVNDPTAALPMLEARAEYLAEAFATVESTYGDMTTYVREGLGVTDETVAGLRAGLLEGSGGEPRRRRPRPGRRPGRRRRRTVAPMAWSNRRPARTVARRPGTRRRRCAVPRSANRS